MSRASIPTDPVGRAGFFVFLALAFSLLAVLGSSLFSGGTETAENPTLFTVAASAPDGSEAAASDSTTSEAATSNATVPAPSVAPASTPTPFPTTAAATDGTQADAPTAEPAATAAAEPTAAEDPTPEPSPTATPDENSSDDDEDATPEPTATPEPQEDEDEEPAPAAQAVSGSFARTLRATGDVAVAEVFDAPDGVAPQVTYTYLDGTVVRNDLTNPTYFGNPLVFRVLEGQPGDAWAKIMVPTRPNGQVGWIQTDLYEWGSSNYLIQIDVGTNQVAVFENDELILQTDAATGTDSSPTPLLTAFVDEKIFGRGGPYGPVILSLGVYSNALNTFGANGEVPKIALHGTNQPDLLGEYVSNGCIRIKNEIITQIADLVPVGTKVEIVRS